MFRYCNNNNNKIQTRMNLKRTNNYQPPLQRRNGFEEKRNVHDLLLKKNN
jgi:hypothetical protein